MTAPKNQVQGLRLKAPEELLRRDRLPSFKTRDLTLGGLNPSLSAIKTEANANKKVFKPNLNVARTKNSEVKTSRDTAGRGRARASEPRGSRNAAGPKRNSSLVQSQGVFSEGGAAVLVKKSSGTRSGAYGGRESSASEVLTRPVINKVEVKVDPEEENRHIKEILGENDEDDTPDDGDKLMPISVETYKHMKKEAVTSSEGLEDFMRDQTSGLLLLQLPDTLPGMPAMTKTEAAAAVKVQKEGGEAEMQHDFYTLRQVPEGQIGKLLKYRSGKMKLVLGDNHVFDITYGIDQTFLQEVVSISTNKQERSGQIINLGKVQGKLSVTPDWTNLFDGGHS